MRINKKLIPSWAYAKTSYGTRRTNGLNKEYVDCINLAQAFLVVLAGVAVIGLVGWGIAEIGFVDGRNSIKWKHECDLIANGRPHYTDTTSADNRQEACYLVSNGNFTPIPL